MEVKHIIPAYSTAGHGGGREKKDSKRFDPLLKVVKRFAKKFNKNASRKKFSNVKSAQYDSNGGSIKDKLTSIKNNSVIKWGVVAIISALILVGGAQYVNSTPAQQNKNSNEDSNTQVKAAIATQDLNQEFTFPLRDSSGEDVSTIKYTIEKAELRDEIIVKGKKATAIDGRTFLILTLKLQNEHTQAIEIDTRDYIRLSVNGNENEWLAPDIHNDPVEVQAISTKPTRVGFPINETDKDLLLRIGEIRGDKQRVELDL